MLRLIELVVVACAVCTENKIFVVKIFLTCTDETDNIIVSLHYSSLNVGQATHMRALKSPDPWRIKL